MQIPSTSNFTSSFSSSGRSSCQRIIPKPRFLILAIKSGAPIHEGRPRPSPSWDARNLPRWRVPMRCNRLTGLPCGPASKFSSGVRRIWPSGAARVKRRLRLPGRRNRSTVMRGPPVRWKTGFSIQYDGLTCKCQQRVPSRTWRQCWRPFFPTAHPALFCSRVIECNRHPAPMFPSDA